MRLGSFTLDGTTINVDTDFDQITGLIYRFVRADSGHQIAVTTYKGMELAAGAKFDKADLQRGLDSVRKPIRRLSSRAAARGDAAAHQTSGPAGWTRPPGLVRGRIRLRVRTRRACR